MNPLLQVKLKFAHERNSQKPGPRNLKSHAEVSIARIDSLLYGYTSSILYLEIWSKTGRTK